MGLALLLAAVLGPSSQPEAQAANVGFVKSIGGRFVLDGEPFRFVGTNAYYLYTTAASGSFAQTDETMTMASELGLKVLRTWGFADGTAYGPALQPSAGVYDDTNFRALDYVLYRADLAGVRLIVVLVNRWGDFGGMPQYVSWCAPRRSSPDRFYTEPACKDLYKRYVSYVLNRVNSYNGRVYKNDPTIFAWELANEPEMQDQADLSGQTILDWVREMADHVKSIDPNHMVGTGEEGFDTTSSGYSPISAYNNQQWLLNGWKGVSFTENTRLSQIDYGSIHLYPEFWNLPASAGQAWISDHAAIATSLGKPLLFGEFGSSTDREAIFESWLGAWQDAEGGGAAVWQLMCASCYGWRDQFGILYEPGIGATAVLATYATLANASSGGGGGTIFSIGPTSATPASVTAGQTVAVATSIIAAEAVSDAIVHLEVLSSSGITLDEQRNTGQTFAAGESRSYTMSFLVPAGQAPETCTVRITVSDASGVTVYAARSPAASFAVVPAGPTFTIGPTTAGPNPVLKSQMVAIDTAITTDAAASGIIVDIEVWTSSGSRVAQKAFTEQSFTAGQTRAYHWDWRATVSPGTYTVKVGVFPAGWGTPHVFNHQAATVTVVPR